MCHLWQATLRQCWLAALRQRCYILSFQFPHRTVCQCCQRWSSTAPVVFFLLDIEKKFNKNYLFRKCKVYMCVYSRLWCCCYNKFISKSLIYYRKNMWCLAHATAVIYSYPLNLHNNLFKRYFLASVNSNYSAKWLVIKRN